jgi:hypothetical protein
MKLPEDIYQRASFLGTVFLCCVVIAVGIAVAFFNFNASWRDEVFHQHFAAIVGLPCAAVAAFIVITHFRQVAGPIEVEVLGSKLREPAALYFVLFGAGGGALDNLASPGLVPRLAE